MPGFRTKYFSSSAAVHAHATSAGVGEVTEWKNSEFESLSLAYILAVRFSGYLATQLRKG